MAEVLFEKKMVMNVPEESVPYLVAHRGGSLEAPENTLQSFQHSIKHGVDVIECDVLITKDGEVIVCHDKDF